MKSIISSSCEMFLFSFSDTTGRVSEQPWRQQRCQILGQQNDICAQVQVSKRKGEDDQLH